MLKPSGFCVSLFSLKETKKKKNVEAFRVLRDQIEREETKSLKIVTWREA